MPVADDGRLTAPKMIRVPGLVWCESHGTVHDDTLDPYDYGHPECFDHTGVGYVDKSSIHRPVYYRARRGDYP